MVASSLKSLTVLNDGAADIPQLLRKAEHSLIRELSPEVWNDGRNHLIFNYNNDYSYPTGRTGSQPSRRQGYSYAV